MKEALNSFALVAIIIAGIAVAYYYGHFLPNQQVQTQQDINSIRRAVAPTADEREARAESDKRALQKVQSNFEAYMDCMEAMRGKRETWLAQQCPADSKGTNMLEQMNCRSAALTSPTSRQFDRALPL